LTPFLTPLTYAATVIIVILNLTIMLCNFLFSLKINIFKKIRKHPQKSNISWIEKLKMQILGIEKKRKIFLFF
jgi:hypothetical protein